ncbi:MAG TPA: hypothetical protein VMF61_13055 [Candidatus Acidoferrales bacterium]|nr:hypothetical protein [Candidatus Acidoferrales bacterium]
MDIAAASTAAGDAAVANQIDLSLLTAQQNLAGAVAAELAASLGLGTVTDAYA